jgi:hypothetical protein
MELARLRTQPNQQADPGFRVITGTRGLARPGIPPHGTKLQDPGFRIITSSGLTRPRKQPTPLADPGFRVITGKGRARPCRPRRMQADPGFRVITGCNRPKSGVAAAEPLAAGAAGLRQPCSPPAAAASKKPACT